MGLCPSGALAVRQEASPTPSSRQYKGEPPRLCRRLPGAPPFAQGKNRTSRPPERGERDGTKRLPAGVSAPLSGSGRRRTEGGRGRRRAWDKRAEDLHLAPPGTHRREHGGRHHDEREGRTPCSETADPRAWDGACDPSPSDRAAEGTDRPKKTFGAIQVIAGG